jgi:dihydrofolate reductase
MGAKMGELMGQDHSWLFGRRTYQDLLMSWNAQGGPFKDALNNTSKFVASSDPACVLDWPHSTLLHGDVPAAVASLRETEPANLVIMGSGVLIRSLMAADLIDTYLLFIHPLLLGAGHRLFDGSVAGRLRMIDGTTTVKGVVIATYDPVGA